MVALCLMPFNWLIETIKWRVLVTQIQKISFLDSVKSILAGVLLSLPTPNRIGELGGRLLYIEKGKRTSVFYINSVCSLTQVLITTLLGLWSFYMLNELLNKWVVFNNEYLLFTVFIISIVLLFVYFYSNSLHRLFNLFSKQEFEVKLKISYLNKFYLMGFSFLRYLIFIMQFYLLMIVFEPQITFLDSSLAIALTFFITAAIPTGGLSDLPVRTSIVIYVLDLMGYNGSAGLSASIILWIINLLIPAIFSLIILRKIDWVAKFKWRKE